MEIIYIVVLFIAPGMIVRELWNYFNKERRLNSPVYSYLFFVIVDSFVVNAVVIAIINIWEPLTTITAFVHYIESFKAILIYVCIMSVLAVGWFFIRYKLLSKGVLWVKNRILNSTEGIIHTGHTTVWDTLMNEEDVKGTWRVVSIYKDDEYISSGMIEQQSSTNAVESELVLDRCSEVKEMMEKHPEHFKIDYEYYNVSTGLRMIIYDQKLIEEHWEY